MCDAMPHIKKYAERASPAYPANECCGQKKKGKDGRFYVSSRVGKQKVCTWKPVRKASEKSPKRSPKRKSV